MISVPKFIIEKNRNPGCFCRPDQMIQVITRPNVEIVHADQVSIRLDGLHNCGLDRFRQHPCSLGHGRRDYRHILNVGTRCSSSPRLSQCRFGFAALRITLSG